MVATSQRCAYVRELITPRKATNQRSHETRYFLSSPPLTNHPGTDVTLKPQKCAHRWNPWPRPVLVSIEVATFWTTPRWNVKRGTRYCFTENSVFKTITIESWQHFKNDSWQKTLTRVRSYYVHEIVPRLKLRTTGQLNLDYKSLTRPEERSTGNLLPRGLEHRAHLTTNNVDRPDWDRCLFGLSFPIIRRY